MATNRLCGYCRQEGHRADKCSEKEKMRIDILSHTPQERKWTLEYMAKQGFGEGCTFYFGHSWSSTSGTFIITDPSFVRNWQFGAMRKIRYSKQVRFTPMKKIDRFNDDTPPVAKGQYDYLDVSALFFGNNVAEQKGLRIRAADIVAPSMYGPDTMHKEGVPLLIEPSYKMFDVDGEFYAQNVHIHKRVAGDDAQLVNRWDDVFVERGIPPR